MSQFNFPASPHADIIVLAAAAQAAAKITPASADGDKATKDYIAAFEKIYDAMWKKYRGKESQPG